MKINQRLQLIGDLVPLSSYPLDIGCDHALLSIYLVKERGFQHVAASDNKKGPLDQARKNAHIYQVDTAIDFILAAGLEAYQTGIDVVTISGMGGLTINRILLDHPEVLNFIDTFILSPNNYSLAVKKNLVKFGYFIQDEYLVQEKNMTYPIYVFKKGKKHYSSKTLFLGPVLATKLNDPVVRTYYQKQLQETRQILSHIPRSYYQRRHQLKKEIKWLEQLLDYR